MKKLLLASLIILSGCSSSNKDFIVGHWSEENKTCGKEYFCSFTVTPDYKVTFDVVPKDFPNTSKLVPNYKGTPGVYLYTDIGTDKGIMMYLDKDTLVETHNGTRFKKSQ